MAKLFAMEDIDINLDDNGTVVENDLICITEDIEDSKDTLEICIENYKNVESNINLAYSSLLDLNEKEIASVPYFISLENYSLVMKAISSNLGVAIKLPSLEDFKNPYGIEASHQIATESKFFEFVKRIWEKIKDLFASFFKKINMFLRRLLKYDLDLEHYEKYLDEMISRFKSKKPTITDNKVTFESKLPSLLANEGMESVNSDFILNVGTQKMRQLGRVVNEVCIGRLSEVNSKDFKDIKEQIDYILKTDFTKVSKEDLEDKIEKLKKTTTKSLNKVFSHGVKDTNELPDSVYTDLQYHFDRTEIDDLTISSIVDDRNLSESLPKNFNSFLMVSENSKLFIGSSTEFNQFVQNKLNPIGNIDNLITFYEEYKKLNKDVNIKRMDGVLSNFEKEIDGVISIMRGKFTNLLESLKNDKKKFSKTLSGNEKSILEAIVDKVLELQNTSYKAANEFVNELGININVMKEDRNILYNSIVDYINDIPNSYEFMKTVADKLGMSLGTTDMTRAEVKVIIAELEDMQKFLLNYLQAVQVLLKEISVNLAGVYSQLRFELVKYIYNSGSCY